MTIYFMLYLRVVLLLACSDSTTNVSFSHENLEPYLACEIAGTCT